MSKFTPKNQTDCEWPKMLFRYRANGLVSPCCKFVNSADPDSWWSSPQKGESTLTELFNSSHYRGLRERLSSGQGSPGCGPCMKIEAAGGNSFRLKSYQNKLEPIQERSSRLRSLEFELGNLCNLKCRSCNSTQSTLWMDDDLALNAAHPELDRPRDQRFHKTSVEFLDLEALSQLEIIYLAGGEPMLHNSFSVILERVHQSGNRNCALEFSTNCTRFPNSRDIEHLLSFGLVEVYLSIDGVGEENEFLRPPSVWSETSAVVDKWVDLAREHQNVTLYLSPTVSVYNINSLGRLTEWWFEKLKSWPATKNQRFPLNFCILNFPEYLQVGVLPDELRADLRREFHVMVDGLSDSKLRKKLLGLEYLFDVQAQSKLEQFRFFERSLNDIRGVSGAHPFARVIDPLLV